MPPKGVPPEGDSPKGLSSKPSGGFLGWSPDGKYYALILESPVGECASSLTFVIRKEGGSKDREKIKIFDADKACREGNQGGSPLPLEEVKGLLKKYRISSPEWGAYCESAGHCPLPGGSMLFVDLEKEKLVLKNPKKASLKELRPMPIIVEDKVPEPFEGPFIYCPVVAGIFSNGKKVLVRIDYFPLAPDGFHKDSQYLFFPNIRELE
ncbi:MAG: hypothetical protein HYS22_08340 [Deltaproteobacteria bacterium]|nr:hypothetical protein [Deltaproteobacteria bacterium]